MKTNNDERILQLKKKIQDKKDEIGEVRRFAPKTNCSLVLNGVRYNIHTLKKENVIELLVQINLHKMSAENLGLEDDYQISNYSVSDWMNDLKGKLSMIKQQEQLKDLEDMEKKLAKLLSNDKRVELEIDEIANLLE